MSFPQEVLAGIDVPRYLAPLDPMHLPRRQTDVLVVGGGVAGLSAAIAAGERRDTLVLLKGGRRDTATNWAQGGMAVVWGSDDTRASHIEDTTRVASGLGHRDVTEQVVGVGPQLLERWLSWGARFDRKEDQLALAMEGGHSHHRIIHADGDQTGAEIQRFLIARAASLPRLGVMEHTFVLDLITDGPVVRGVIAWSPQQGFFCVWAASTILSTGGVGQLYRETSNPRGATADGIAMAYRAGAPVRGMEFVQFHPTVLYVAGMSRILVSETARGEGALLVDRNGHRFMPDYHPDAELAPRDAVSRSIVQHLAKVRDTNVYLDMRHLDAAFIRGRFPVIFKACLEFGIDMTSDLIPVHPACHYMVGGVATDDWARTALTGLYAAGEVGSSGFHGANRMGSNSLLEGAVLGDRAGLDAAESDRQVVFASESGMPSSRAYDAGTVDIGDLDNALRALMWRRVGIQRDGAGLESAITRLHDWNHLLARRVFGDEKGWVLANKALAGWLIAHAASVRKESRGTHYRLDYTDTDDVNWLKDVSLVRPDLLGRHARPPTVTPTGPAA